MLDEVLLHNKPKNLHRRLTYKETSVLKAEFAKSHDWSAAKTTELANQLGLKRTKVYKWNWDKRKRMYKQLQILASQQL